MVFISGCQFKTGEGKAGHQEKRKSSENYSQVWIVFISDEKTYILQLSTDFSAKSQKISDF